MCYTLGQQSNNYLSYDQYDQACSYRYNNDPDPGCCIGSEDYGSFEQLQVGTQAISRCCLFISNPHNTPSCITTLTTSRLEESSTT